MLNIRAHHLLCIPRYFKGGYDKVFAKRHKTVCMDIRKNPEMKLKIVRKLDDLCAKCPNKKENICMKKPDGQDVVMRLDGRVLKRLKIKENSVHKARDILNLSMERIPNVKVLCKDCWYYKSCTRSKNPSGINNSFRIDLNKN